MGTYTCDRIYLKEGMGHSFQVTQCKFKNDLCKSNRSELFITNTCMSVRYYVLDLNYSFTKLIFCSLI
jgi:hypothetical protein